jgi:GTP-binding protein
MSDPIVALLGAPNVGKSTLFNRLAGGRPALVHPRPGMTRDRMILPALVGERAIRLMDTGGIIQGRSEELAAMISSQSLLALQEADLVILMVDGRAGCSATDRELAGLLRRQSLPVVVAVNKLDVENLAAHTAEFHELGLEPVLAISAEHGLGMADLAEAVCERLPATSAEQVSTSPEVSLALIGRPNVGKSSLLNRLLNEQRVIVSDQPGTTRDSIDTLLRAHDHTFRLVDTAGLRRRTGAADTAEQLAIQQARRALARCQVAALVMDARAGVTAGDLAVAGEALESGRAVIPVLNKWDLLEDGEDGARQLLEDTRGRLRFLPHSRPLTVSALTGLRVRHLLTECLASAEDFAAIRPTAAWNRALRDALRQRRTPLVGKKPYRIFYAVQTGTSPPSITLFVNRKTPLPESYMRFLGRQLRASLDLERTPVRIHLKTRPSHGDRRQGGSA